jgi:hypothetical protein
MGKVLEFIKSVHADMLQWCHGRMWYVRLPLLVWFAYILVNHIADPMYQSLFKSLNLGIHELGHPLFSYFGEFMHAAGGTILQCAAPVAAMVMFARMRDYFAIAVCFGWLSTNLFDVATYVADARARVLPLVTPGRWEAQHDWYYMLGRLGMLHWDGTLAFLLRVAAVATMLICLVGGGYLLWRMYRPVEDTDKPVEYKSRIS